jgi:hypothetical protein
MPPIDYTIPGQFKGIQIESPINRMAAIEQLENARQQQQMNALKMQEYARKAREDQELASQQNELAKIHSSGIKIGSPEYFNLVATKAPQLLESVQERALKRSELDEKIEDRKIKNFERKFNLYKSFAPRINSIDGVTQITSAMYEDPDVGPVLKQILPYADALNSNQDQFNEDADTWRLQAAGVSAKDIAEIARNRAKEDREANKPVVLAPGGVLVSPSGDEIFKAPDREKLSDLARLQEERAAIAKENPADPRLKQYDAAIAKATATNQPLSDLARKQNELAELEEQLKADPGNKLLQQRIKEYRDDIRKDTTRPVTNVSVAAPVTPVTIQDPKDPSKAIVVDGRTGKVIGTSVKEGPGVDLTARERQAREAKYPQATAAIKTYESKSEELAKDLETLANHPGLDGISGAIFGRTPSGTKNSMAAQEKYNSIVARGGFKELADMRAASPTGGALGNVSNQEGQYLRDAFGSIGRTQSKDDLAAALKEAAKRVRESKGRIREAYDMTYEYRSNAAPTSNAPAADPLGIRK